MGLVPGDVRRATRTAGRGLVHRDEMVLMHVRAYIWMLLSICFFGDKTGARAHRFPLLRPPTFNDIEWPLASRLCRFLPSSDKKDARLQRLRRQLDLMPFNEFVCLPYRMLEVEAMLDRRILQEEHRALWCSIVPLIYFGTIEWHQVDRGIPQFGGVQNRPHPALNIDFLHAKDGRGSDQWFPQTFQRWHALWATRRYLVPANRFHHLPPDEIPLRPHKDSQATCEEDDGWDEDHCSGLAYLSPTPHTQGTTILSTMSSPSQHAFLDGLHSSRFEQLISDIMREGDSGYRPDMQFDGSLVHLDLNEPMSGLSHLFMALGGTPPSASHVPGASWDVPFMEHARLPTPPVLPAPAEQPSEPAAPG
ncbi:hypothetical protein PIB30_028354 [Stylosanthes scabra]|uniref:Aminotransferase-like plant mobile domain-containing protein n=1 Tax=Stylosanthes scabra TaxID=79078 RepID=A0ABU6RBB3_9FABA|nr:hypothetical protein [Stylosanthes scabra]